MKRMKFRKGGGEKLVFSLNVLDPNNGCSRINVRIIDVESFQSNIGSNDKKRKKTEKLKIATLVFCCQY